MLTQNQVLEYQGNRITFDLHGKSRMINATEMALPFGKKPAHFLRSIQTQAYMSALLFSTQNDQVANSQLAYEDVVKVVHGGTNKGTWMHEQLALKFAAWLSPRFEVWVFQKIKELLLQGHTAIVPQHKDSNNERIEALEAKLKEMEFNMFRSLHYMACAFWEKEIADDARFRNPKDHATIAQYLTSFSSSVKKATEHIH